MSTMVAKAAPKTTPGRRRRGPPAQLTERRSKRRHASGNCIRLVPDEILIKIAAHVGSSRAVRGYATIKDFLRDMLRLACVSRKFRRAVEAASDRLFARSVSLCVPPLRFLKYWLCDGRSWGLVRYSEAGGVIRCAHVGAERSVREPLSFSVGAFLRRGRRHLARFDFDQYSNYAAVGLAVVREPCAPPFPAMHSTRRFGLKPSLPGLCWNSNSGQFLVARPGANLLQRYFAGGQPVEEPWARPPPKRVRAHVALLADLETGRVRPRAGDRWSVHALDVSGLLAAPARVSFAVTLYPGDAVEIRIGGEEAPPREVQVRKPQPYSQHPWFLGDQDGPGPAIVDFADSEPEDDDSIL